MGCGKGRTTLLDELHRKVNALTNDDDNDFDDDDAMNEMDNKGVAAKVGRAHRKRNKIKVTLDMPRHPPEVAGEASSVEKINLLLERKDSLWIHLDHVPWVIKYMFIQQQV